MKKRIEKFVAQSIYRITRRMAVVYLEMRFAIAKEANEKHVAAAAWICIKDIEGQKKVEELTKMLNEKDRNVNM